MFTETDGNRSAGRVFRVLKKSFRTSRIADRWDGPKDSEIHCLNDGKVAAIVAPTRVDATEKKLKSTARNC